MDGFLAVWTVTTGAETAQNLASNDSKLHTQSHGMKRKQTQWERLEQCGNLGAVRVHGESRKTLPTESALSYAYWNSFILQRSSYLPTNSNTTATDPRTPLCTVGPWRYKMRDGGPRNSNLQNLGSIVEFSGNWEPILIIP